MINFLKDLFSNILFFFNVFGKICKSSVRFWMFFRPKFLWVFIFFIYLPKSISPVVASEVRSKIIGSFSVGSGHSFDSRVNPVLVSCKVGVFAFQKCFDFVKFLPKRISGFIKSFNFWINYYSTIAKDAKTYTHEQAKKNGISDDSFESSYEWYQIWWLSLFPIIVLFIVLFPHIDCIIKLKRRTE